MTHKTSGMDKANHTVASLLSEMQHCRARLRDLKDCFKVATLINTTLELEEVLDRIMTTSRTILRAEACSLMLVDESSGDLVFEVAQGPVASQLKSGLRIKSGEGIAGHVFATSQGLLIEDAYQDKRFNPEFDRMTGFRTRSILCVPILLKERIIGVSQVINRMDGSPFTPEDEETLELLCTHAAVAIENARMHRALLRKQQIDSDLAFAASIQQSFLPQSVPQIAGFRFKTHYRAALEVGGDFYNFIPLSDGKLGIIIGDVSGKGVASALYMARLTSDFHLLAIRHKDPRELIGEINNLLCERSCRGMFVTLLYLVLDPCNRRISFINAGHIPPVLWNRTGKQVRFAREMGGPPAGILPDRSYTCYEMYLDKGECMLLCTDGLIEAKGPAGDRFGFERLEGEIKSCNGNLDRALEALTGAVERFTLGCPQSDDITMVLLGSED